MSEQLPKETAFTVSDALAYLRTDQSDLHDRLCADIIETQAHEIERLRQHLDEWIEASMKDDEQHGISAALKGSSQPPPDVLTQAARKIASYNAWNETLPDGRRLCYVLVDDIEAVRSALTKSGDAP